jgi:hypothetical protein
VVEGHLAEQADADARPQLAEGRRITERPVADADVLIANFRPGVMEK